MCDSITNEYIGLGHVTVNEENAKEAEIGYMLLPEHWGKDTEVQLPRN